MTMIRRISLARVMEELEELSKFEMGALKEMGLSEQQVKQFWERRHEKEFDLMKDAHDSVRKAMKF